MDVTGYSVGWLARSAMVDALAGRSFRHRAGGLLVLALGRAAGGGMRALELESGRVVLLPLTDLLFASAWEPL